MKAQVSSSNSPVEYLRHSSDMGKVHKKSKNEKESQEITKYLTKLQELVPFTPKNKKLSKLEVISCVIDYIQDLRETLGLPPSPCQNGGDHLDEKFTWLRSMESSAADDDWCQDYEVLTPAVAVPVPAVSPATLTAAATITVTSGPSPVQHFQHRQPLCVISKPGGNTDFVQTHLSLSTSSNPLSVKSSTVLTSASTNTSNCGHPVSHSKS